MLWVPVIVVLLILPVFFKQSASKQCPIIDHCCMVAMMRKQWEKEKLIDSTWIRLSNSQNPTSQISMLIVSKNRVFHQVHKEFLEWMSARLVW